jgi:hypothetical protein
MYRENEEYTNEYVPLRVIYYFQVKLIEIIKNIQIYILKRILH